MNKRSALWLAAGIFTGTLAIAGCQKKEEPVPAAIPAPAAPSGGAPTVPGAVAPAPGGSEASPGVPAAAGETKTVEQKREGTKKY